MAGTGGIGCTGYTQGGRVGIYSRERYTHHGTGVHIQGYTHHGTRDTYTTWVYTHHGTLATYTTWVYHQGNLSGP